MSTRDLEEIELWDLQVFTCNECCEYALGLEEPPAGWVAVTEFIEEQDQSYPTGEHKCPRCNS